MVYEKELDAILEKMAKVYDKTEVNVPKWHITKNKDEKTWTDREGRLRKDIKLNITITQSYTTE